MTSEAFPVAVLGLAGDSSPDSSRQSISRPKPPRSRRQRWLNPDLLSPRTQRLVRILANLIGAGGAALFAVASLRFYLHTHRLIGAAFLVEQTWIVIAYLMSFV